MLVTQNVRMDENECETEFYLEKKKTSTNLHKFRLSELCLSEFGPSPKVNFVRYEKFGPGNIKRISCILSDERTEQLSPFHHSPFQLFSLNTT